MRIWALCLTIVVAAAALLTGCSGPDAPPPTGKPTAVATIFAYYDALRAIGGDKINVVILLPPKKSPHEFQATARNRDDVEKAALVVKNGLGIDDWVDRLLGARKPVVLTIGKDADVLKTEEVSLGGKKDDKHEGHEHHGQSAGNPHIWLDPQVQIKAAEKIRDALCNLVPAEKATFEANTKQYTESLRGLDSDFRAAASKFKHKDFVGFHSAYEYLARRYGLKQVAAIEEVPEAGLTANQIDKVVQIILKDKVAAVFSETAMGADVAKRIAQDTKVQFGVLQPLETYDQLSDTYVSLMRDNLRELQRTLGK